MSKILIVAANSRSLRANRLPLINELLNRGNSVFAMVPKEDYIVDLANPLPTFLFTLGRKSINPIFDFINFILFFRMIVKLSPDYIISYSIKPIFWSSLASFLLLCRPKHIPIVCGLGTLYSCYNITFKKQILRFISYLMYKFSICISYVVFFQNPDDYALLLKHHNWFLSRKKFFRSYGSGVDISDFVYVEPPISPFTFLFASRILYDKGIIEYIHASRRLKKLYPCIDFIIVGNLDPSLASSPTRDSFDRLLQHPNSPCYLGSVSDIKTLLSSSTCIVNPSFYREGVPRICLEALATGRPLITTDTPGSREVVDNGHNGFICKPQSSDSLYEAMLKLYNSRDRIIDMSIYSRELARSFYDSKQVAQSMCNAAF